MTEVPTYEAALTWLQALGWLYSIAHVRESPSMMEGLGGQMLLRRAGPSPKGGLRRCAKPIGCPGCSVRTAAGVQQAPRANRINRDHVFRRAHSVRCSLSQRSIADQRKFLLSRLLEMANAVTKIDIASPSLSLIPFQAVSLLQRPQQRECPGRQSGWLCQARGEWQRTLCSF